ncbi:MAG: HAMP domain-containing protein [Desulfobulbaceae bacterium]|nr:HAMP domain-containing protein [Desulfobulbaceae bacterium]
MKIKIQQRLFLAILAAAMLAVIFMYLIMYWNFGRGFLQYVNSIENEMLSTALIQAYTEKGSWDFLQDDPANWPKSLTQVIPGGKFDARLLLLDENLEPIFGKIDNKKGERPAPLTHQGKVVSYLILPPREEISEVHQIRFVKQQELAMLMIAGVILFLSVVFSLFVTRRLVRPIKELTAGTHRLAGGDYTTRVAVTSRDELAQLALDFNALALALENNEKAHRQWVADISHELRTPLSVLLGEIEALQDGIRNPDQMAIQSLHAEVVHISRLIDDIYQLSLYDVGAMTYRKEQLDLAPLLWQVVDSFRGKFAAVGIKLSLPAAPAVAGMVYADRERLRQLFVNLLDNSLKYTASGGELAIEVVVAQGQLRIDFRDSAPGVVAEELDMIFDRFYRVEGSRNRESGGIGLGLAICRSIVEAHEGTIAAKASPLGGLWITISLPLTEVSP